MKYTYGVHKNCRKQNSSLKQLTDVYNHVQETGGNLYKPPLKSANSSNGIWKQGKRRFQVQEEDNRGWLQDPSILNLFS